MSEITEFQKVAALVCMDIDLFSDMAKDTPESAPELMAKLRQMKDDLMADKELINKRYSAASNVFSASQSGLISFEELT